MTKFHTFLFAGLIGFCSLLQAAEGLRLPQTRVIFNAGEKRTTAGIQNLSHSPYLVKAQVLNAGKEISDFFMVTPPLFRLESQSQYSVRILSQGAGNLPADRESLFYLSFLAIPSADKPDLNYDDSAVTARVSIGVQTLIKMFYRPLNLSVTPREAQGKLVFCTRNDGIVMDNPTPYYLTLNTLILGGENVDLSASGAMIAPFSQKVYPVKATKNTAVYTVINDYGGISQTYRKTLSAGEKKQ